MKKMYLLGLAVAGSVAVVGTARAQAVNVALDAPVTVVATDPDPNAGFNNGTAGNLSKVTDGILLVSGSTPYGSASAVQNAVEWSGAGYVFQIDLGAAFALSSVLVQADDNDAYNLQYHDASTNTWAALYTAPIVSEGVGIVTRAQYVLPASITTDAVRFSGGQSNDNACFDGTCGQGGYAVSQIELFGNPISSVPEPASIGLMLSGLGCLGALVRRKRAA